VKLKRTKLEPYKKFEYCAYGVIRVISKIRVDLIVLVNIVSKYSLGLLLQRMQDAVPAANIRAMRQADILNLMFRRGGTVLIRPHYNMLKYGIYNV
jgi:hypothetical protein